MRVWIMLLLAVAHAPYQVALPGYSYAFPRDHFAHPAFRTEWWYYTGNVWTKEGRRFGFELVFFRQGARSTGPQNASAWAIDDVYLAHAALTDVRGQHFWSHERWNRQGPGIAGIEAEQMRVWNGNWSAEWRGNVQTLRAITPDFRFQLEATAETAPVIHGIQGVSQKSEGVGRASHYVSLPRLATRGRIQIGSETFDVSGTAWMDHEWFTQQLAPEQVGWDWFSIQLQDKTEIMLFELRRKDGSVDNHSAGTWITPEGVTTHLRASDFQLKPVAWWNKYPIEWEITVPGRNLHLRSKAVLPNQALARYWEGAVDYTGSTPGVGYLEMTGYQQPFKFD